MLTTKKLTHQYKKGQGFQFPDFSCQAQETLLVLGQSGVGKTTLLHILAGILKPTSGEVLIDDTSIYKQGANKLDRFRGQHIGLVFQKPHFVQAINARENLLLAQRITQQKLDISKIDHLLNQLNIAHRSTAKVYKMSQGEQQRLSIARALANDPKVILADEPTSALDDKNCKEVINLLHRQAEAAQAALIIVTHDNRLKEYFTNHIELN